MFLGMIYFFQEDIFTHQKDEVFLKTLSFLDVFFIFKEGNKMDDHLYDAIMSYAELELIPRFQTEYKELGKMKLCPSYEEVKDLCTALNAVAKWSGNRKVTPSIFVELM